MTIFVGAETFAAFAASVVFAAFELKAGFLLAVKIGDLGNCARFYHGRQLPAARRTGTDKLTTMKITSERNEKPDHQRPEHHDFWDKRFGEGATPWNAGGVPLDLMRYAEECGSQPRTLIPGCGHAWEAAWLACRGWEVTALDFSAAAVEAAREQLGNWHGQLVCDDFFSFTPAATYDLIYERAFLCALPRKRWQDYGRRMHELLAPGGRLIGFFFFSDEPKGPPFGITPAALDDLLSPWFVRERDEAVSDSIAVFAGRERWQVWRRKT